MMLMDLLMKNKLRKENLSLKNRLITKRVQIKSIKIFIIFLSI